MQIGRGVLITTVYPLIELTKFKLEKVTRKYTNSS